MAIHEIFSNKNAIRVCGNNTYYKKFFTADSLADVEMMNTHGKGFLRYPAGTAVLCFEDSTVYVLTRDDNPYGEVNDEENAEFIPMSGGVTPAELEEALATKQDLLTAGAGIGITDDEIRVTYGESHYGEPVYDAAMEQTQYTDVGTLYCGMAGNHVSNMDLTPLVTANDIIKIVTDVTATDCAFIVPSDEYQQKVVWFASQLNVTVEHIYCNNCHGLYISDDFATAYLVDENGDEQTESAYVFALAKSANDIPLFLVLANNDYPMSGTYTISKKYYDTLPDSAYDFGAVAVGDERPVNGDTVKASLDAKENKSAVVELTAPSSLTLADNTEYYLTNVSNLSITYPSGRFEAWIRLTTATSGTVTIELPTSQYIGTAPTFGNGETWEISIKDGVVIAQKVGDGE